MIGIPGDLYGRVQSALLRCGPFDSDRALRSLFVDARLSAWRDLLPEASNRVERARAVIDALSRRANSAGENALALLLSVLAENTPPGDACREHLMALAQEIAAVGHTDVSTVPASPAQVGALRQAYLYRLMQQTRRLPLGGVDPKSASDVQSGELRLSAVYTALLTQRQEVGARHTEASGEWDLRRLSAVEVLNAEPCLVLLGDPGSGKTTFVNFVALCLAGEILDDPEVNLQTLTAPLPDERPEWQRSKDDSPRPQPWDHGALLPVRVVLRDFAARGLPAPDDPACRAVSGDTLWTFIVAEVGETLREYMPHLKQELLERGGIVLLDGLDEVPDSAQRRVQVKAAVQDFASCFPRCRFLVTSRTYAYQRQDWKLDGFSEVALNPFTPGQVARFVDGWYAHIAAVRGMDAADAQGRAVLLKTAIERNERLAELATRPLLLTLMASLHAWRGGSLPEKREELYADTVALLLDQWESPKVVRDAAGRAQIEQPSLAEWLKVDRAVVRAELERMAFEAHRDQPRLEGTADVAQLRLVDGLMRATSNPEVNPVRLAEYLRDRAGLLVARGEGVYTFPHRTFQEYLAACFLTDHGFPRQVAHLLRTDPQRWREAVLLAGAKASRGSLSNAWYLAEALCPREVPPASLPMTQGTEEGMWGALLAAQVLLDNLGSWLRAVDEWDAPKLERIRLWLRAIVERGWLPPVDRRQAGAMLATLGDDRDFDTLIVVPEGPFWMGDDDDDEAKPCHKVTLPVYLIGKYPVTVGQFRHFVDASGYKPRDPDCLRGTDNHPVVWVTWHDARAYCQWLTGVWREAGTIGAHDEVRLPSETEWEKAASWSPPSVPPIGGEGKGGQKRAYPWGVDWAVDKANTVEGGLGTTSPVGMYPEGASPYGCLDMAGNVWTWTRSLWGKDFNRPDFKYPYRADHKRENVEAGDEFLRMLRGGSFNEGRNHARCTYRHRFNPYLRYGDVGFRIVVSLSRA